MKAIKTVFIVVVVIAVIGAVLGKNEENGKSAADGKSAANQTQQQQSEQNTSAPENGDPPIQISSTNLLVAYDDNEVNADNLYKGKLLKVSGEIGTIGKDILDDAYITLIDNRNEYAIFSVQCYVKDQAELDKIADLHPGQIISLVGTCKGATGNIVLKNCTFAGVIG